LPRVTSRSRNSVHWNNPASDGGVKTHERIIISSLKQRTSLEIIVIELSWRMSSSQYSCPKTCLQSQGWELHEKALSSAEHFSDRISTEFDLIIGLSANYFHTKVAGTLDHLSSTPAVPNSMSPKILVEFNDAKFALPYIGDLFTVELHGIFFHRACTEQDAVSLDKNCLAMNSLLCDYSKLALYANLARCIMFAADCVLVRRVLL
jgi:hypothetical protein